MAAVHLLRLFFCLPRVGHGGSAGYGLKVEAFFAGGWFGIVVFFLRIFEVFVLPDIFAEQGFVHAAGVDDDVGFVERLEVGAAEIERRGLQSVEHEAGGFGVELAGEREAHDLHEADLDGVGVLEDGEVDGGARLTGASGVDDDALIVPLLVKVAETVALEGRRSALRAVDFDVLAAGDVGTIHGYTPRPPRALE